jgi:hypothetical protein
MSVKLYRRVSRPSVPRIEKPAWNWIQVIDLGLRLEDVEAHDLEAEHVLHRTDPTRNLLENGATEEGIAFLQRQRVELNAFASADLIAWIEAKLEQQGITKLVPDDACLRLA